VQNNLIRSRHDAYAVKGDMKLFSSSNVVRVNPGGIAPFLTTDVDWKCTGFHHNISVGDNADDGSRVAGAIIVSSGDQFSIEGGPDNIGDSGQLYCVGILNYTGSANNRPPIRQIWNNPTVYMRCDLDGAFASTMAAFAVDEGTSSIAGPIGLVTIYGLTAHVEQTGAGDDSQIYGIRCRGAGDEAILWVPRASLQCITAGSGATYACYATTAYSAGVSGDRIACGRVDYLADNASGGSGTVDTLTAIS